jgi:hypothetical protein
MPRTANIEKKKEARPIIPPSYETDAIKVPTKSFIEGIVVRLLNGLNNLNVLNALTPSIPGSYSSNAVTTTIKSSQFHASVR